MKINSPIIELLAIELYKQDFRNSPCSWFDLDDTIRDRYRAMARGEEDLSRADFILTE